MFSNLYYLSTLITKSLSFSLVEKQRIFNYSRANESKLLLLIKTFEDEQRGLEFIKSDYKGNINRIGSEFKDKLNEGLLNKNMENKNKIRNKIKEMNIVEINEINKESKNLDTLINNI